MTHLKSGKFIISLDFELNWGVRDVQTLESYGNNILGVRQVIPALLNLFQEYAIHATWSTVGFLFFKNKKELLENLPIKKPQYINQQLSPYPALSLIGDSEDQDHYHYGFSLLQQIKKEPNQEIGTHTFSHYYCLERGQTIDDFRADLQAAVTIAEKNNLKLTSLVFPRNQYNTNYLSVCAELGIICYRGNESSWIYKERNEEQQKKYKRAARLIDAYLNLSGHNCYSLDNIKKTFPINIPASRFLRPYSPRFKFLEDLRLKRILTGLTYAAEKGLVYHLWWHPHNFGVNLEENMSFLRKILDHYKKLKNKLGLESFTMSELAHLCLHSENE